MYQAYIWPTNVDLACGTIPHLEYARKPQLARELTAAGEKVHSLESIIFLAVRDYRFQEGGREGEEI